MNRYNIIKFCALYAFSAPVFAIAVTVTDANIPSSDLGILNTAGEYFPSSVESDPASSTISISGAPMSAMTSNGECGATNPSPEWKVSANISAEVPSLNIRVKRTNSGSGGALSGGSAYSTNLSTLPVTLFCGWGDVSGINLQFQIDNIGPEDGYGTKAWNINYTVETL